MAAQTKTVTFAKAKETKNTVMFEEKPEPGQPPIITTLYVQKWFVNGANTLKVTVETES
jgi:hypothetical protein